MDQQPHIYGGVRPSDLRLDSWHMLAEYIAQAQRLVDSAAATQQQSERLVQESAMTARRGVVECKTAVDKLTVQSARLESALKAATRQVAIELTQRVTDAQAAGASAITLASAIASTRFEVLASRADEVNKAAARLEQAADRAGRELKTSNQAFEYLKAYKKDLLRVEAETLDRIASAKTQLYRGASVWTRMMYVFRPPRPQLRALEAPSRPAALKAEAKPAARA